MAELFVGLNAVLAETRLFLAMQRERERTPLEIGKQ